MNKIKVVLFYCLILCSAHLKAGVFPISENVKKENYVDLSGEWNFIINPSSVAHKMNGEKVGVVQIPCQFDTSYEDFYKDETDSVLYIKEVFVPSEWKDKIVKLRFNSVEGKARVFLNGCVIGEHLGFFLPYEYDLTRFIRYGEVNEIRMLVGKTDLIVASGRDFLGMCYKPELYALNKLHISGYEQSMHFSDEYDTVYFKQQIEVSNALMGKKLRYELKEPNGKLLQTSEIILNKTAAQETLNLNDTLHHVKLWNPEYPWLYTVSLKEGKKEIFTTKVGFREIKVRGKEVRLNGNILKIKGINFHPRTYLKEHAMSREDLKRDILLFKAANINFIRPFPAPPMYFHELCDSLGMMNSCETASSFVDIEWAPHLKGFVNRPGFCREYLEYTQAKIAYYKKYPSIIMWSLGNESLFTAPIFVEGGCLTQLLDSTRLVVAEAHESLELGIELPQTTIDCLHYPNLRGFGAPVRRPIYYGEWCHLHEYSKAELNVDPGVRDAWVNTIEQHTAYTHHWGVLGGNVFSGNDFFKKGAKSTVERVWGILDLHRRPKPEYWHVRKSNSPVRILSHEIKGDSISFRIVNRFLFTNLGNTKIMLNNEPVILNVAPLKETILTLFYDSLKRYDFSFYAPNGDLVDEYSYPKSGSKILLPPVRKTMIKERKADFHIVSGIYTWMINKTNGLLEGWKGDSLLVRNGPFLVATPNHKGDMIYMKNWKLKSMAYDKIRKEIVVCGMYDEAEGKYIYRLKENGVLEVVYEFDWLRPNITTRDGHHKQPESNDMREIGICFELSEQCNVLTWKREGYWTDYPMDHIGRPEGTAEAFSRKNEDSWRRLQTKFGCNDFVSTKMNIHYASLLSDHGDGLEVYSNGKQHLHCLYTPDKKVYRMLVMHFYSGGHEQFTHGNGIKRPMCILEKGDYFKSAVNLFIK